MANNSDAEIKRVEPNITGLLVQQQKIISDLSHLEQRVAWGEDVLHDQIIKISNLNGTLDRFLTEQGVLAREAAKREAKINPYKVAFFSGMAAFIFGIIMWWLTKPPTVVMPYNYGNPPSQHDKTR